MLGLEEIALDDKVKLTKQGYVYILIHPTQYGYLKIGETKRTPEERAKELTQQCKTGLAGRYTVAYEIEVDDSKLVEIVVHKKLKHHRITDDREFFHYELKAAIKVIEGAIEHLKTMPEIEFYELVPEIWWNNLSPSWQQTFKRYVKMKYMPSKEALLKGVYMVINYSRIDKIREKVIELISNKNYSKQIEKWYKGLDDDFRDGINPFIPQRMTRDNLNMIINLNEVDCSGNRLIENLLPIADMNNLKILNCSSTSINTLAPLKELFDLEEIKFNNTYVDSLEPLENLKKLRKISCNQTTTLSEEEIERFKETNPKCEILTNPFEV